MGLSFDLVFKSIESLHFFFLSLCLSIGEKETKMNFDGKLFFFFFRLIKLTYEDMQGCLIIYLFVYMCVCVCACVCLCVCV